MHPSRKSRLLITAMVLMVCLSLATAMALAQTTGAKKAMKGPEPIQGQQLCPSEPAPAKTLCSISIDCPRIEAPGQTLCQPGVDCPPGKTAKPEKGKKKQ